MAKGNTAPLSTADALLSQLESVLAGDIQRLSAELTDKQQKFSTLFPDRTNAAQALESHSSNGKNGAAKPRKAKGQTFTVNREEIVKAAANLLKQTETGKLTTKEIAKGIVGQFPGAEGRNRWGMTVHHALVEGINAGFLKKARGQYYVP